MGQVRVGTASWTDRTLIESGWYPPELREWAPKIAALARDTTETHVLFNNCYRNYAQVNAQQLAALLSAGRPS